MPGIHRFLGFYLLIGLIQGIVFYYSDQLYRLSETVFFVTYTVVLVGGTILQLLGKKPDSGGRCYLRWHSPC